MVLTKEHAGSNPMLMEGASVSHRFSEAMVALEDFDRDHRTLVACVCKDGKSRSVAKKEITFHVLDRALGGLSEHRKNDVTEVSTFNLCGFDFWERSCYGNCKYCSWSASKAREQVDHVLEYSYKLIFDDKEGVPKLAKLTDSKESEERRNTIRDERVKDKETEEAV